MIITNLKYIKLALWFPYILMSKWGIYLYQTYIFSGTENLIFSVIFLLIVLRSSFGLPQTIMKKELYRRIAKLPIAKSNIMNWQVEKNVGISFMDFEKNTFWFCGTQTNFIIHIIPMENIKYKEMQEYIIFSDSVTNNRYVVFKYSQT